MSGGQDQGAGHDSAADIARETMIRVAVTYAAEIIVILSVSVVIAHREDIARGARRAVARARRRWSRIPPDAGLQIAELNRAVTEWSHANG